MTKASRGSNRKTRVERIAKSGEGWNYQAKVQFQKGDTYTTWMNISKREMEQIAEIFRQNDEDAERLSH